jgi:hypothetical protein
MPGEIQAPIFTENFIAAGAINKGCVVQDNGLSGNTRTVVVCTSGIGIGIAATTVATGDQVTVYKFGSECEVAVAAAVTVLTVPLTATTGGQLTPQGSAGSYMVWPRETTTNAGSPSFIRAYVSPGYKNA